MNKDALSDVTRFTIGVTPVIDVTRLVADFSAINAGISVDGEEVRVMALHRFIIVTTPSLHVTDPFAGIFEDPFPLSEASRREDAPALNGGIANDPRDVTRRFRGSNFRRGRRSFCRHFRDRSIGCLRRFGTPLGNWHARLLCRPYAGRRLHEL
jgi:hypothetical protein